MAAKNRTEQPTKADKQALQSALTTKFGLPLARVRQLIDDADNRITRTDIERAVLAYLRTLPKA